jgi:hypothetical protein
MRHYNAFAGYFDVEAVELAQQVEAETGTFFGIAHG